MAPPARVEVVLAGGVGATQGLDVRRAVNEWERNEAELVEHDAEFGKTCVLIRRREVFLDGLADERRLGRAGSTRPLRKSLVLVTVEIDLRPLHDVRIIHHHCDNGQKGSGPATKAGPQNATERFGQRGFVFSSPKLAP